MIPTDSDASTVELENELNNDQFKPTEDSFQLQPQRERLIAQCHGISRTSKHAIFLETARTLEFVDSTWFQWKSTPPDDGVQTVS